MKGVRGGGDGGATSLSVAKWHTLLVCSHLYALPSAPEKFVWMPEARCLLMGDGSMWRFGIQISNII